MDGLLKLQINSRQQQIISLLLQEGKSLTLNEISDHVGISGRTIQRELDGFDQVLAQFNLSLGRKTRVGLSIEGEESDKKSLQHYLSLNQSSKIYSPEERQLMLKQLLLTLKDPTKLFYFANNFGVTEATISNDLLKIEPWFIKHHVSLVRKQGVGVYIQASEKNIREAIIDLFYEHFSHEKLMDILSSYSYSFKEKMRLEFSIRNRLLNFIDKESISKIEDVVHSTEKWGYFLTDSAYVGLVVHISLAIQRLKNGEIITIDPQMLQKINGTQEYQFAREMAKDLEVLLDIDIPESEVGYITMHLLGAKLKKIYTTHLEQDDLTQTVLQMAYLMEQDLKVNLANDVALIEHLCTHLKSAIHRIRLNMEIRNPLLLHIKEKYSPIFESAKKAALCLEEKLGVPIPEEEIGYLALHFGAAVVKNGKNHMRKNRVVVVCSTGMGTSRMLSAQLERQFSNVEVVDTVPLLNLEDWLAVHEPIDLIISTIPFEYADLQVVVVNPLLLQEDITAIQSVLTLSRLNAQKESRKSVPSIEDDDIEDAVQKVNRYGDAMVQLLNNTIIIKDDLSKSKSDILKHIPYFVDSKFDVSDTEILEQELRKREELGAWLLKDFQLAMLHSKTETLEELCICLLQLEDAIFWGGKDSPVNTVMLLLAPKNATKEQIEMISLISSELIEDDFTTVIVSAQNDLIKKKIKQLLGEGYKQKTQGILQAGI